VAHALSHRLQVPKRMADEGEVDALMMWLINSQLAGSEVAAQVHERVARGAMALMRVSISGQKRQLLESTFWSSHYYATPRLRDVMCWAHGARALPFVIDRLGVDAKQAKRCDRSYEAATRRVAARMAKILGTD
jgi:hypothetical protein